MYQVPFDVPHMTCGEAVSALKGALRFGIQPMLESVQDMLAELGDPDLRFRSIQIAGTNGKTSTSATPRLSSGRGACTALYTLPSS